MKDLHQNIFFYYRGPSTKDSEKTCDIQIEDNTTKAFINILELLNEINENDLLKEILLLNSIKVNDLLGFRLQITEEKSRPDAAIYFPKNKIYIETKVKATLSKDQLKKHLSSLDENDALLVITNKTSDAEIIEKINNEKLFFLTWSQIYKSVIEYNKKLRLKSNRILETIIIQFIQYLEVVVMTEFNGFREEDFSFFYDRNKYYKPILKNKLDSLMKQVLEKLPGKFSAEYNDIYGGNIKKDLNKCWCALRKENDISEEFRQCNFTIEISDVGLKINTVIRNGNCDDIKRPIGYFFKKLSDNANDFLNILTSQKYKDEYKFIVCDRTSGTDKIYPGSERWHEYFSIDSKQVKIIEDVIYIKNIMNKVKYPGIRVSYFISHEKEILAERDLLLNLIADVFIDMKPLLDFIR